MKKCDVIFLFIDHVKLVPFHCYVLFTFDKLLLVPVECFTCFYFIFSFLPSPIPLFSSLSDKIQVIIVCQVGNKKYTNILSLSRDLIQALVIHRTHWFSFLNLPSLFSSFFLLSSLLLWSVLPPPSIRHLSHPASFLIYQYNHFVSFRWDWNELFSCDQKFIFLCRLPRIMNEEGPFASP